MLYPARAHILSVVLLEDDEALRDRIVAPELRSYGLVVHTASDATQLDAILQGHRVNIAILDVNLPGEDGFSVLNRLRNDHRIGLIMLTASADTVDQVRGLNGGADAYLVKPVATSLLAATLRSVARRLPPPAERRDWALEDGGWVLRSVAGKAVALTTHERTVMVALFAARGRAVDRSALIEDLARDVHDFDPHRLEMTIHRLRSKVSVQTSETLPVRAVRGRGYVMQEPGASPP